MLKITLGIGGSLTRCRIDLPNALQYIAWILERVVNVIRFISGFLLSSERTSDSSNCHVIKEESHCQHTLQSLWNSLCGLKFGVVPMLCRDIVQFPLSPDKETNTSTMTVVESRQQKQRLPYHLCASRCLFYIQLSHS
jgi:hypothetical protein